MKKVLGILCAFLLFFGTIGLTSASQFIDDFPSDDSTVIGSVGIISIGEFGYFWSVSRGDLISETFTGTGLNSVNQIDLEFSVTQNVLSSGAFTNWDVLVNDNVVGSWSWKDSDGTGVVDLSFNFADIFGAGTYDIAMEVTNEVAGGSGSIAIGYPGEMILTGGAAVPEPATMMLFGIGILGLAGVSRKKN